MSLAFFAAACSGGGSGSYDKTKASAAPDFSLSTVSSGKFSLAAQRGKVVLLEFMSYNCPACYGANEPLVALNGKYGKSGLQVVAVSVDADADMAGYARQYGITYPIALDTEQETAAAYRLRGTPTFVVVDKQGKIRRYWAGFDTALVQAMESAITELLQEPA